MNKHDASDREYVGLALKYRPECLSDVVGQTVLTTTIRNMVRMGKMARAYVLVGSRGTGKTTTARILAKIFNCTQRRLGEADTCLKCNDCVAIKNGCHADVIEIDAASNNSVDAVRNVIEMAQTVPSVGRNRVFIFDEFHMLSASAFNALLRTIEEPPTHAKFIFATTEVQKIPATILSRCLRFDLVRISDTVVVEHLQRIAAAECMSCAEGTLAMIAAASGGSLRDALFLLEHVALLSIGKEITHRMVENLTGRVSQQSCAALLVALRKDTVTDLLNLVGELADRYANLSMLVYSFVCFLHKLRLRALLGDDTTEQAYLSRLLDNLVKARTFIQDSPFPREALEMIFIDLFYCSQQDDRHAGGAQSKDEAVKDKVSEAVETGGNGEETEPTLF